MADAEQQQQDGMVTVAVSYVRREKKITVGAAVHKRIPRSSMEDEKQFSIEVYEFLDGEQFSSLDAFLMQVGSCVLYLPDDLKDGQRGDGRKISNLLQGKDAEITAKFVKKSTHFVNKSVELNATLLHLVGKATHNVNNAEHQMPQAYLSIECLMQVFKLSSSSYDMGGKFVLDFCSISNFMRLDSAAAEAVHLLPKPDQPSQFGSLFGVLNRCKTKMGARLLERWLRQPLLDPAAINQRLDIVEVLKNNTLARTQLSEGPLKSSPDLDNVLSKMHQVGGSGKSGAGLAEVYKLYTFTRSLPDLVDAVDTLVQQCKASSNDGEDKTAALQTRFVDPLKAISIKFGMFQQLVEHVIDMEKLPEFFISAQHDKDLEDIATQQADLTKKAKAILSAAQRGWADFCDVKLEGNNATSFFLRSTKGDDERQLRANNKHVKILSIQKNGVHFTTPELECLSDSYRQLEQEYDQAQRTLVVKTVETAATYLPVAEAASAIVAELDVLVSFAQAAALSPSEYVRPKVLPVGSGVARFKKARHPCVELMDNVNFIPNDYDLVRGSSSFQIVTGPNMGGKSTYIRGIGCIVAMAQVGSFVPCEEAEFSAVDAILARVGAGDAVQKGVSTFMAEMLEASVILQTATQNSLIIVDELGRGTSTFDGFGIAWAISEYLVTKTQCLCLFATHFHELTALSRQHPSVVNKHVSAHVDEAGKVTMLYNVADGPCLQSFGIHIAVTADFPPAVIAEAKRKAAELESVGADFATEEGKQKQRKIKSALESYAAMDVENMKDEALNSELRATFVLHG
jgi:DNA mismatch repair protein MSH2